MKDKKIYWIIFGALFIVGIGMVILFFGTNVFGSRSQTVDVSVTVDSGQEISSISLTQLGEASEILDLIDFSQNGDTAYVNYKDKQIGFKVSAWTGETERDLSSLIDFWKYRNGDRIKWGANMTVPNQAIADSLTELWYYVQVENATLINVKKKLDDGIKIKIGTETNGLITTTRYLTFGFQDLIVTPDLENITLIDIKKVNERTAIIKFNITNVEFYDGQIVVLDPEILIDDVDSMNSYNVNVTTEGSPESHVSTNKEDMIIYTPFNLNTSTVYDYTDKDIDGTKSGTPAFKSNGLRDGHYYFDGSSYINFGDDDRLDMGTHNFTILMWFNYSGGGSAGFPMNKRSSSGSAGYGMLMLTDGTIKCRLSDGSASKDTALAYTGANDGNWHFVACVFNRDGGNIEMYDEFGRLQDSDIAEVTGSVDTSSSLQIGARAGSTYYTGEVDELMIFNRSLTVSEVYAIARESSKLYRENAVQEVHVNINQDSTYNKINITTNSTLKRYEIPEIGTFEECTTLANWTNNANEDWEIINEKCSAQNTDEDANITIHLSKIMELSNLTYNYSIAGGDAGEYLKAYIRSDDNNWVLIDTYTGSTTGQNEISISEYVTLGELVSLRFGCNVNSPSESCYVDKINVTNYDELSSNTSIQMRLWEWNGTTYNSTPSEDSIYGWYHLDGNLVDSSDRSINATFAGAIPDDIGVYNTSYFFDNINDEIRLGNATDYMDTCNNGCTFSVWFNNTAGITETLFSKDDVTKIELVGYVASDEDLSFIISPDNTGECSVTTTDNPVNLNVWNHYIATWNTTAVKLYLNGELMGIDTAGTGCTDSISSSIWDDNRLQIGRSENFDNQYGGNMDEIIIWNRSLSDDEMIQVFARGRLSYEKQDTWKQIEDGDNKVNEFNISTNTENILMEINYSNDKFDFYSGILRDNIIVNTWTIDDGEPPVDSCEYTSGDWNVDCSDDCVISTDVTVDGSSILLTGTGTFTINNGVSISGYDYLYQVDSCPIIALGNGGFYQ